MSKAEIQRRIAEFDAVKALVDELPADALTRQDWRDYIGLADGVIEALSSRRAKRTGQAGIDLREGVEDLKARAETILAEMG